MAYGIQIRNGTGTNEIFGYNVSNTHFLAGGSVRVYANNRSVDIDVEGMTALNTNTIGIGVNSQLYAYVNIVRETGSFYITNTHSTNFLDASYFACRY